MTTSIKLVYDREADQSERHTLHRIFNQWLYKASDEDYRQFAALREHFASGEVCSVVKLLRGCMADPKMLARLPTSLRLLLREQAQSLPPAANDGTVP